MARAVVHSRSGVRQSAAAVCLGDDVQRCSDRISQYAAPLLQQRARGGEQQVQGGTQPPAAEAEHGQELQRAAADSGAAPNAAALEHRSDEARRRMQAGGYGPPLHAVRLFAAAHSHRQVGCR